MSRFLLDTNILSDVIKPVPSLELSAWMAEQANEDLFISSMTVGEIWRGVLDKPAEKRRRQLERWFWSSEGPPALFAGRMLSFDDRAALIWGRLMAEGSARGNPRSALDMVIAAVAEAMVALW